MFRKKKPLNPPVAAPQMTVKQYKEYVSLCVSLGFYMINNLPGDGRVKPGDTIEITFSAVSITYFVLIIDDIDWGLFEDLRAEWDINSPVSV